MDAVCGRSGIYNSEWLMFRQAIADFQHQKELLARPYAKTSDQVFDFNEDGTKPVITQQLYDQAAKEGFPIGFFRRSYFEGVTLYCVPDHTDFNFTHFSRCTFAVCRIREATFDGAFLSSCDFHSCDIRHATFYKASIAHTHFHDSALRHVSFQDARLKSCNIIDCGLASVGFLNAALDGCTFGRVTAQGIRGLHTATITQGGATEEEVKRNRESIFAALRPEPGERRAAQAKGRGAR